MTDFVKHFAHAYAVPRCSNCLEPMRIDGDHDGEHMRWRARCQCIDASGRTPDEAVGGWCRLLGLRDGK